MDSIDKIHNSEIRSILRLESAIQDISRLRHHGLDCMALLDLDRLYGKVYELRCDMVAMLLPDDLIELERWRCEVIES